jgi:hypothetical protein
MSYEQQQTGSISQILSSGFQPGICRRLKVDALIAGTE